MLSLNCKDNVCSCGKNHKNCVEIINFNGALKRIATIIKKKVATGRIAIVYTNNVAQYAQTVLNILVKNAFTVSQVELDDNISVTKGNCEKILGLPENIRFIIAIGGGSISTLVRYSANCLNVAYGIVATCPSTDSYLDNFAKFDVDDFVICGSPIFLIADDDILENCPGNLLASGIGAVFSCYLGIFELNYKRAIYKDKYCTIIVEKLKEELKKFVSTEFNAINFSHILMEILLKISLARNFLDNKLISSANNYADILTKNKNNKNYGENLFVATFVIVSLYKEFLEKYTFDTLIPADYVKGLKLLEKNCGLDYNKNIRKIRLNAGNNLLQISYLLKEYRNDFMVLLNKIDENAWAKYFRRCYKDAGFWLNDYIKANEILSMLSLCGIVTDNSLLNYIKSTGFMEEYI